MIGFLEAAEHDEATELYALGHPGWPRLTSLWHFAHPTLVIRAGGRLAAAAAFSVAVAPLAERANQNDEVMWGRYLCVHPDFRGQGLGTILFADRLDVARELGLHFFIGMTWPSDTAMIRIFEAHDCVRSPAPILNAYPHNPPRDRAGVMYTRGL